jgi:hypothetical protein
MLVVLVVFTFDGRAVSFESLAKRNLYLRPVTKRKSTMKAPECESNNQGSVDPRGWRTEHPFTNFKPNQFKLSAKRLCLQQAIKKKASYSRADTVG